jgi:hypothetical protein
VGDSIDFVEGVREIGNARRRHCINLQPG